MTVKELINELKKQPQDAICSVVSDWDNCGGDGNLLTKEIQDINQQYYYDDQFTCDEIVEVIMVV